MINEKQGSISFIYKLIAGFIFLIMMFFVAMIFGAADTSIKDVWLALTTDVNTDATLVLREIRFPREVAAIFVGAALSVAGAIMQGLTRNPLADPGLLGLTAGANAALAIALVVFPSINYFGLMIGCFIGAAIGTLMVFSLGFIIKLLVIIKK